MEQKKQEKDVLIVRDEKTGEIGVVAGLGKDGNPKLSPPKAENKGDFMLFNKHDDMLESFFKNFYRQTKEPHRFGFYRVAAENVEHVIDVFKEMLKNPEANKEMLAPHKVDTEKYQNEVKEEQVKPEPETKQEEKKETPQQEKKSEEKQSYKPIDETRIDWDKMKENYGIDRDALEASGDLKKMLNYRKSSLITVTPNFGGERFEIEARLSLKEMPDGSIGIVPHPMRKEPKLEEEFKGHTFTDEDKAALGKTGNMGRVVDLVDKSMGEIIPSYISIDRQTNNIESIAVKDVFIPKKIGNTPISKQESEELRAGRGVRKQIELANGKKFTTTLQVNADHRGVEFVPRTSQTRQTNQQKEKQNYQKKQSDETKPKVYNHRWTDENGNIRAPKTLGGVELSPDQQKEFTAGKAILVKDMMRDGKGEPYTAYVKYNHEAGKPKYYRNNPDVSQKQEVTPTAEHRTQVAVNSQGKTNEATKHVKEPLKQGQEQPKESQKKNKGMKI